MSPATLRRFRADRLLRREFEGLRVKVLAAVRGRLLARGVMLDRADLEACYSLAWHGLYAALLAGERIESPAGWLTIVAYRRALDEHRARSGAFCAAFEEAGPQPDREDRDLAAELDDRARLGALFEGIRGSMTKRERQAAVLCYLHGLSRREAACQMGLSEGRMRKLMEGCGDGRPGVSGKIGALARTIEAGDWCEQRGSLMRAYAYGILDMNGERYELAVMHHRRCPACRAYVASLRGLAVLLPPAALPASLLGALGSGGIAAGGPAAGGAAAGGPAAGGATVGGATAGGATAGGATGGLAAAGVAGGAGGGGWALAGGPLGAKLAVGCLLALGAGCATLGVSGGGASHPHHRRVRPLRAALAGGARDERLAPLPPVASGAGRSVLAASARSGSPSSSPSPRVGGAGREFGLEGARAAGSESGSGQPHGPQAAAASVALAAPESARTSAATAAAAAATPAATPAQAAQREFGPG
jgi:DNA-directed RNA polymerase specialized sigma24 family protein